MDRRIWRSALQFQVQLGAPIGGTIESAVVGMQKNET